MGQGTPHVSDPKAEHGGRPVLSHRRRALQSNQPHLRDLLTNPRRLVPMVAARTQQSYLVAGHGGTAALYSGTPAVIGHGKAQREAHELYGDYTDLMR